MERSSDQVIKPVNLEALNKWVNNIPEDVVKDMPVIAPMLAVLGYDPLANPPNYGSPDAFVAENTKKIQKNVFFWEQKAKNLLIRENESPNPESDDFGSDAPAPPA